MNYFLIVGEASGDLHASHLMSALKEIDSKACFRYYGGDLMQSVGGLLLKHYKETTFMGLVPILLNWYAIYKNFKRCKNEIASFCPDVVILVDYSGFNLQIAKQIQVPHVFYFIPPKIWAWRKYRIQIIKKYIDLTFCILPFEKKIFKKYQLDIDYLGNPIVDIIKNRSYKDETWKEFIKINQLEEKPIITLVAGSRKQEIKRNLPSMIQAAISFNKEYQIIIAAVPNIKITYYKKILKNYTIRIIFGQTYRLLKHSRAALVTSGTATLETALLNIPQVVCYKLPFKILSSFIFNIFFTCRYISLVNLIANRKIVVELFGRSFSVSLIREELAKLLYNSFYRKKIQNGYKEVINKLGPAGAPKKIATRIYTLLSK